MEVKDPTSFSQNMISHSIFEEVKNLLPFVRKT